MAIGNGIEGNRVARNSLTQKQRRGDSTSVEADAPSEFMMGRPDGVIELGRREGGDAQDTAAVRRRAPVPCLDESSDVAACAISTHQPLEVFRETMTDENRNAI